MGRMQMKGKGKGISGSALPFKRRSPKWLHMTPSTVVDLSVKLAKKGLTPSQIGVILRDQHGIPQVRFLTGQKILRILKKNGCAPQLPEDLYFLIKKALSIRKHLEKNRKDKDSKYRLILVESRIHRLSRYYKLNQKLPLNGNTTLKLLLLYLKLPRRLLSPRRLKRRRTPSSKLSPEASESVVISNPRETSPDSSDGPDTSLSKDKRESSSKDLKFPPQIHQFTKTLDKNQSSNLFKLLASYAPEKPAEKKQRLVAQAEAKKDGKQVETKKPIVLKYGLNHITTLIENKQAKLVVIAHDVDPIELVIFLPQLCRKNDVPFAFVKGKAALGKLVNKKTATAVALTEVRNEDKAKLQQFSELFKTNYNANDELRKTWGGGILGQKSQHKVEALAKAVQEEQIKKAKL